MTANVATDLFGELLQAVAGEQERDPEGERDALVEGVRAVGLAGRVSHAMTLGIGPLTIPLVEAAWTAPAPFAVSGITHDPAEGVALMDEIAGWSLLVTFILSVAPAVLRTFGGEEVSVYDPESIVPASLAAPDLIVVYGLPREMGGRLGALRQAVALGKPGTVLVVPKVGKRDRDVVAGWLAEVGEGAVGEEIRVGKARHVVVRRGNVPSPTVTPAGLPGQWSVSLGTPA